MKFNKMYYFYLLALGASLETDPVCPSYVCGQLPAFSCIQYDQKSNTNTVQKCANGLYCQFNYTNPYQSVQCKPEEKNRGYPGESCISNEDCLYGECQANKTCAGYHIGKECNDTLNCDPGLYCKSSSTSPISVCSPLIPAGLSGCTRSTECSNLAYCNVSSLPENSYCQASLSFRPGTLISNCYNGINYMCEHLYCVTLPSGSFCTSTVPNIRNLPAVCQDERDCISASDPFVGSFFVGNCSCGINPNAKKYCKLFPGDPAYTNYVFYLSLWLNSEKITNCNSKRRMSLPCIKTYTDEYNYNVLVYYIYLVDYYPQLQGNPSCVRESINTIFWESDEYLLDQPVESSSVFVLLLGALYLV